ncbi:hypothetical protein HanXRQr2_Chr10g0425471 [Helianthus annuus]|uniref:BIRD-IDD transcription factor fourth C2HC zinc finger domain-containing protein n=1 Tax=Helianthus annuus TaxID=4232 RepID=A0A251TG49_HELAN|nr:hypothetical protein HanXRQr2_Chr10g0425471 [Helianthus annuus]KAJ0512762.1 hypothetical protein HanHA300_Chr10g0349781 [Helianthus annuus]KAJ0520403.1 hypothetical protein HanIR_Chr10g0459001 [Helianthus annuus]KAJ0528884.1 hypothetical protein HanHA89_Chr10g0371381 [Helianthus annuus]KAJ0695799.1 hypothetical protein HanLR1_Chr10g0349601 [Helianthus annuus]
MFVCRKDSFITHRAFCDALTEENNKMNQEMLQSQQMSDDYMNTRNSMSMGLPQFNNYNPKSPLKLHPQEIPMLYRPMNISAGLFSTSSGTLINNPIVESSSSIGLELSSSNGPVGYVNFQQTEGLLSAHMSATALLQKAAEIGATASNIVNSPIIQKSYVTSMAGPDQPNSDGPRPSPSYCHFQGPFHNFQTQPEENNALPNPILQGTFGPGPEPGLGPKPVLDADPVLNNIGVYSDILKGADHSLGLMNMEHGDRRNSNSDLIHGIGDTGIGRSVSGRGAGRDTLIVDFLGTE